jgi:hypothetical protein
MVALNVPGDRSSALSKIDVPALKACVDLCELAGRYTTLKPWGRSGELAGPCPQPRCPADEDGFHVHPDGWWKCYTCHPKRADAIAFVQWLDLALDFRAACEFLATWSGGGAPVIPSDPAAAPKKPSQRASGWADPAWQAAAQRLLAEARAALAGPAGEPGRAYLVGRGIVPEAWQAWRLGYTDARFDPRQERRRPAIVLPWYGPPGLTSLKYRFLDSQGRQDRFGQLRGGQQILFGGHLLGQQHDTLILCEGELNAVSIWQAVYTLGIPAVDVVSFGSQGAAVAEPALALARRYRQIILWADETAPVRACLAALGSRAFGLRSPTAAAEGVASVKLDANALLQRGLLEDLLRRALARLQVATQAPVPGPAAPTASEGELAAPRPPAQPAPTVLAAASAKPGAESKIAALPAPRGGETVRIPLDGLAEYLAAHQLKVVGGDPGLGRRPWRPILYMADRADGEMYEHRPQAEGPPRNA